MRLAMEEPRLGRRGMTPNGCFAVAFAMLFFIALVAGLSGYFFYRNFGAALFLARDEVQPVGERFLEKMSGGAFQEAYALVTESCQTEWPPEKFGEWAKETTEKLGALGKIEIDARPTTEAITAAKGEPLTRLPMRFVTTHEKGTGLFDLMFEKSDAGWLVAEMKRTMEFPKKGEERNGP